MSLASLFKRLSKIAPVIIANAPALAAAVKEVKKALKKPKKPV
jgi:hypothetical protein